MYKIFNMQEVASRDCQGQMVPAGFKPMTCRLTLFSRGRCLQEGFHSYVSIHGCLSVTVTSRDLLAVAKVSNVLRNNGYVVP